MTAVAGSDQAVAGERGPGDRALARIGAQIDLPRPVAAWVLTAHLLTLLSPLVLSWAVHRAGSDLDAHLATPFALHVAAGLFLIASAFEIAQNTVDRWYYTGPYAALSDLLFNGFIAFGLGALALADGGAWWLVALVVAASVAFPVLYLRDAVPYPATGVLGLAAVAVLVASLDQPVVALLLVFTTGLNLYFLALVVRTHAQSLHGAIALTNGVGLLAVPWAVLAATGTAPSPTWPQVAVVAGGLVAVAVVAWRPLSRLAPTVPPSGATYPRRSLT